MDWYLSWLLSPLYIFIPAGVLWVVFIGLGAIQDWVEKLGGKCRKKNP